VASAPVSLQGGVQNSPGGRPAPSTGVEAQSVDERLANGLTASRGEPRLQGAGRTRRPTPEASDEAHLTRRLYRAYRAEHDAWVEEASEDLEFYNGAHWTDEQRETLLDRGQKPVQIQTTYQLVEQAVAMLTSQNPSFRATARENSDVSYADLVSDLQQWIWQTSDAQRSFKAAVRDYYVRGLGYMYAHVDPNKDYGKGEVLLDDLDPFTVLPDPNATHPLFDDAAHILVRRIMTAEQIRARWPEAPLDRATQRTAHSNGVQRSRTGSYNMSLFGEPTEQLHDTYEVIERFTKVDREHWRVKNPVTGEEEILDKQEYRNWLQRDAYLVETPQGRRPVTGPDEVRALDRIHDRLGSTYHLERPRQTRDGIQGRPEPVSGPEDGNPRAVPGSTRRIEPTVNGTLVENGVIESHRFLLPRIKVVATVGSNPGRELYEPFDLPVSHYPVVPLPNSHNRNPYPISDVRRVKDLQELINKTNSLILAHAANTTNQKVFYPHGSIQDPGYYEEKWSQAGAAMMPYDPAYGQNGGINVASPSQLPAELYQNQDRFIQQGQMDLERFQDLMSTRYDILVEGGSTLPSNRWSMLQQYLEMYNLGVVDDIAVLKHADIPDADAILQRKSMYAQMQQTIKALQDTVEQLESNLVTARRGEIRAEKKAELAEFQSQLDQMKGNLSQMLQVYQQNLQKEEEKQKAVMQARTSAMQEDSDQALESTS